MKILLIDNYDSFTYNLYHYISNFKKNVEVVRNDKIDGKTILIATHDINNIEEKFDEVICLNRHCCAFGDSSEVLTQEVMEEMYGSHNSMFLNHTPGNHGDNDGS